MMKDKIIQNGIEYELRGEHIPSEGGELESLVAEASAGGQLMGR